MALSSAAAHKVGTAFVVTIIIGVAAVLSVQQRPSRDRPDVRGGLNDVFATIDRFECNFFDLIARQEAAGIDTHPDIVLVPIDESSVATMRKTLGVSWPWPRTVMGRVVRELRALGAKLIVIDSIYVDPSAEGTQDTEYAAMLDEPGAPVIAGFSFGENEDRSPPAGRWAVRKGSYATRGAALIAAGSTLAFNASPYLVPADSRVEVWLGGFKDRAEAQSAAGEFLKALLENNPREKATVRELTTAESNDLVTPEVVFSTRNAIEVSGPGAAHVHEYQQIQTPIADLVNSSLRFGNVSMDLDADGVARSLRHVVKYDNHYYPSLSLVAAMNLARTRVVKLEGGYVRVGDFAAPVDATGVSQLRFYGRGHDRSDSPYPRVSIFSVVKSGGQRETHRTGDHEIEDKIRGKIVLISNEAISLRDLKQTPLSSHSAGTLVLAEALDNLLRRDGLMRADTSTDSLLAILMCFLGALVPVFVMRGSRLGTSAVAEAFVTVFLVGGYLAWVLRSYREGTWVAAVIPIGGFLASVLASSAWNYADESRASGLVRDALGRYTSPDLVEQILKNPQYFSLEGEQRVMTALFTDIKDFTTISEGMKAKELVRLLNDYLTDMTDQVVGTRGQVDKFIGDAVMAYWGAPLPNKLHAYDACRAALRMRDKLNARRAVYKEKYGVELYARAGVNTGEMVVGNMGSKGVARKVNYTIMGDAVNLASRLEGANKAYGSDILIGEQTWEAARGDLEARELDLVRVKGKNRPVRIFELLALKSEATEKQRQLSLRFEAGLIAYRKREFPAALELFQELLKDFPEDSPTRLYISRCQAFIAHPPDESWDGVFEMKDK